MKRFTFASLMFCFSIAMNAYSQDHTDQSPVPTYTVVGNDTVYSVVKEMPQFPGGEEKLFKYLFENIKYPAEAREKKITGRVFASFIIDTDGTLKDIQILRSIGHGTDEEVIRVIKAMPAWIPGKNNGQVVKVKYNLPVTFTLKN